MCLRFVFLVITRVAAGLRLSRREEMRKTAEILILRHQLSVLQRRQPLRPKLDWADRALLGVIPKARRQGLRLLITPDTIVRWHRDIVRGRRVTRSACSRTGQRPGATSGHWSAGLAHENPDWGYRRIHGEMAGLGGNVAASTVWEILKASGIGPARQSGPTWPQFLRSQAEAILPCDFFTVNLLDGAQAYALALIEHATRRIRILGITPHPTGQWTAQQARNLIMDLGDHAGRVKFMIRDHGSNFTTAFDAVLTDTSIRTVLCNVRTPRMNAITERWIGGCPRELRTHSPTSAPPRVQDASAPTGNLTARRAWKRPAARCHWARTVPRSRRCPPGTGVPHGRPQRRGRATARPPPHR